MKTQTKISEQINLCLCIITDILVKSAPCCIKFIFLFMIENALLYRCVCRIICIYVHCYFDLPPLKLFSPFKYTQPSQSILCSCLILAVNIVCVVFLFFTSRWCWLLRSQKCCPIQHFKVVFFPLLYHNLLLCSYQNSFHYFL